MLSLFLGFLLPSFLLARLVCYCKSKHKDSKQEQERRVLQVHQSFGTCLAFACCAFFLLNASEMVRASNICICCALQTDLVQSCALRANLVQSTAIETSKSNKKPKETFNFYFACFVFYC